jgi:hypothetical protein
MEITVYGINSVDPALGRNMGAFPFRTPSTLPYSSGYERNFNFKYLNQSHLKTSLLNDIGYI